MSGLLASVSDLSEARLALVGGADIIDLKAPAAGALGAVPLAVMREVVADIGGRRPVSATIGDLPADARLLAETAAAVAATGVDYVKIGLFDPAHLELGLPALVALAREQRLIAVMFADREPGTDCIARVAEAGFAGIMLDTANKTAGGLCDWQGPAALGGFVAAAHAQGLVCGLAGSLRIEQIDGLLPLGADYLGFRGALCGDHQRQSALDPLRLQQVRARMPGGATPRVAHG